MHNTKEDKGAIGKVIASDKRAPAINPMSRDKLIVWTYLIYILLYEFMVLGGAGYAVFILKFHWCWLIMAGFLSFTTFTPGKWRALLLDDQKPLRIPDNVTRQQRRQFEREWKKTVKPERIEEGRN